MARRTTPRRRRRRFASGFSNRVSARGVLQAYLYWNRKRRREQTGTTQHEVFDLMAIGVDIAATVGETVGVLYSEGTGITFNIDVNSSNRFVIGGAENNELLVNTGAVFIDLEVISLTITCTGIGTTITRVFELIGTDVGGGATDPRIYFPDDPLAPVGAHYELIEDDFNNDFVTITDPDDGFQSLVYALVTP